MAARLAFFTSLKQNGKSLASVATFSEKEVSWLCEMAWNLLRGYVPLYKSEYKLLQQNETSVALIARAKRVTEARSLIAQHGDQVLLPFLRAVVSLLRDEKVRANARRS